MTVLTNKVVINIDNIPNKAFTVWHEGFHTMTLSITIKMRHTAKELCGMRDFIGFYWHHNTQHNNKKMRHTAKETYAKSQ